MIGLRLRLRLAFALVVLLGSSAAGVSAPESVQVRFLSADVRNFPSVDVRLELCDSQGRPFLGVLDHEVQVLEQQKPLGGFRFHSVRGSSETLSIVLVTDVSGSMAGEPLAQARKAAMAFTGRLAGTDSLGLVTFDHEVRQVLAPTRNHKRVRAALAGLEVGGDTAMYDGLRRAVGLLKEAKGRPGIVLLSDGKENSSRSKPGEIRTQLREQGIPVHAIGLGPGADIAELQQLASATGGRFYRATTPAELMYIYQRIARGLVSQYRLEFRCGEDDGALCDLQLVVRTPRGAGVGRLTHLATRDTGFRSSGSGARLREAWNRAALGAAWTGGAGASLLFLAAAFPLRYVGFLRSRRRFGSMWVLALLLGALVGLWAWAGATPGDEFLLRLNLGEAP